MTGAALAAALVYVHFRSHIDPAYESFCHVGDTLDCETATKSRFSSFFGVPLAFWGLAGYIVMAVLAGTRLLLPLAGFATLVALFLAGVSAFSLGVLCPLCAVTWVVDGALFVTALLGRRHAVAPSGRRLAIAAIVGASIVTSGFIAIPRMAPLAAWQGGMRLPHGVDGQGHPWMGASQPRIVVEEFVDYACPHCRLAHARIRGEVERAADVVRLVRHDFARMPCRTPGGSAISRACVHARVAYCAGRAGKFWEMSDWLFSRPKPHQPPDVGEAARDVGVDQAELRACIDKPETFHAAHREYEHARKMGVRGTPAYFLDGKKASMADVIQAIQDAR